MSNGRYFELDKESKSLNSKMVVFNYLRYKNTKTYEKGERIQPEYPIYVVFMKDGVRFYLHTSEHSDNNTISHYSGCILFMPLSLDNDFHCEMTAILNGALDTNITINSNISENHDVNGFDKAIFKKKNSISKEYKTSEKGISKGQLILDFMFDMEHSSVFKNSTMYDKVYSRFHEHHLYNAINTKAEYKFWQKECRKKEADIFSMEMFSRIERKWIEVITNNKSEYLFHESSWFDDNVDEMNYIYESKYSCLDLYEKIRGENKNNIDKIRNRIKVTSEISRDWYMSKYRMDGIFKIRYGNLSDIVFWDGYCVPIVLICLICVFYPLKIIWSISDPTTSILISSIIIVFNLLFAIKIHVDTGSKIDRTLFSWKNNILNLIMPRMFASICAGWMSIGLSSIIYYVYTDFVRVTLLCILLITYIFLNYSVKKELPFETIFRIPIISITMISISMIYSIILGYALFKIFECGSNESFNPLYSVSDGKTLLLFSSLSMFIGVFINMLFHNKSISSYE